MAVVDYPAKRQYQPRVEATYDDVWVVIKSWSPLTELLIDGSARQAGGAASRPTG